MNEHAIEAAAQRALDCFRNGYNCAESILVAVTEHFHIENEMIPRVATPFGGGIARSQGVCGAVSGGTMAIGMILGRDDGSGDRTKADNLAADFLRWVDRQYGSTLCSGLVDTDLSDPQQRAAFRQPGGAHDRVCVPLVADATRYLCRALAAEG